MLTEMIECGCKIKEEVKAVQSEIKKNIQGTTSEGKETRTQINSLEQKEEINIQPEQKETRIQKSEERPRNLHNFKCSNITNHRSPEGEEEDEESENIMENFPSLAKEIDFQKVQEAQRVPKKLGSRRNTPRHIIITLPKIKDKERILEAVRGKETVTYKGVPITLLADFSKETLQARRDRQEVFQVMKGKDLYPR